MQVSISFNRSDMVECISLDEKKLGEFKICKTFIDLISIDLLKVQKIKNSLKVYSSKNNYSYIKNIVDEISEIHPLLLLNEISVDSKNDYDKDINDLEETIETINIILPKIKNKDFKHKLNSYIKSLNNEKEKYNSANNNILKYISKTLDKNMAAIELFKKYIDFSYLTVFEGNEWISDLSPLKKFIFLNIKEEKIFENLPTSNINFSFDCSKEEFLKKLIKKNDTDNIYKILFEENVSPMYEYNCTNLYQFLQVSLFTCLNFHLTVNKCENCDKYFIAYQRSDEKYCDRISPQNLNKTCKQYANTIVWKNRIDDHEEIKLYRKIYMTIQMRAKRNSDLKEDFEVWKEMAQKQRNLYSHGKITKKQYINWLTNSI